MNARRSRGGRGGKNLAVRAEGQVPKQRRLAFDGGGEGAQVVSRACAF